MVDWSIANCWGAVIVLLGGASDEAFDDGCSGGEARCDIAYSDDEHAAKSLPFSADGSGGGGGGSSGSGVISYVAGSSSLFKLFLLTPTNDLIAMSCKCWNVKGCFKQKSCLPL